jgi:hypothetical protein
MSPVDASKKAQAIAALRNVIERFVFAALKVDTDPTAAKKMLEISVEVQPAMEELVKIVTNTEIK